MHEPATVVVSAVTLVRCRVHSRSSTSAPAGTSPQRWDGHASHWPCVGRPTAATACRPSPQPRRSRSASSGMRGADNNPKSVYFQPTPTLRNVGIGGPSPFSAEQLAMPRRPHPRVPGGPSGDAVSGSGCAQSGQTTAKVAATARASVYQRAPPLQLVRPAGLYRSATTATGTATSGGGGTASTAMAASIFPGAAAAQDRLQLPRRSKLTRTPSATTMQQRRRTQSAGSIGGGGITPRNAGGAAFASPPKRRASVSSHRDGAEGAMGGSTARAASRRPRSSTSACTFAVYTTGGASSGKSLPGRREPLNAGDGAPALVVAGGGAVPHKSVRRSGSAPVHRHRRLSNSSHAGRAVPGGVLSEAPRIADGSGTPAVAPSSLVRSTSVGSVHQQRSHAAAAAATEDGNVSAAASASVAESSNSVNRLSAPRRSQSRDGTSGTARSNVARQSVRSSLHTAAASAAARAPSTGTAPTARRPNADATRLTISGTGGPRARPVVSTAAGAATPAATSGAAGPRRLADRKPREGVSSNTVSVSHASMMSMEESKAFLQDFQRMNDRELALFGKLLATVASEQQKRRDVGIVRDASPTVNEAEATGPVDKASGDGEAGIAPPTGAVASADDVTVWTCKRAISSPSDQPRQSEQGSAIPLPGTPGEPAAVEPPTLHADEKLIVVMRRSSRHSASLHAPRPSSASGSEAPPPPTQQEQEHKQVMPQLQLGQLTHRADVSEENGRSHVAATAHAFVQSSPTHHQYHQQKKQCTVTGTAAGGPGSSSAVALHCASRSPSPTPPPAALARGGKENSHQTCSLHSASSSPVPASPFSKAAGARALQQQQKLETLTSAQADRSSSGKLRPRDATDVNASEHRTATLAARKVAMETMRTSTRTSRQAPPSSIGAATTTAGTVEWEAARNRPSSSASGCARRSERRRCGANDGAHTPSSSSMPLRQLSVESYTDIMRSCSPTLLEGLHESNGGSGRVATLKREKMSLEGPCAAGASASSLSSVAEAAAPLAALKRAKELAAELAAAARARAVSADKSSATMMLTSFTPPSTFSADSPTSGSTSMGRVSSGGYAAGAASEICGVRLTAAQLQLLIDSSRSQANYARYQPP
ncbi:hypothetical protein, unknown function [Leishmania tarentolae]|uniref:Uncharacterized protein n=1 Tax=Leishmania tarentolae TaxID=5689 RepID=A0A640K943_LEITA|nr:hypothetical protein, unknown function [Leishmania tarentolae]